MSTEERKQSIHNGSSKNKKGLAFKRWFKEDWRDQRTGKKCGRQKGESVVRLIVDQVKELVLKLQKLLRDDSEKKNVVE